MMTGAYLILFVLNLSLWAIVIYLMKRIEKIEKNIQELIKLIDKLSALFSLLKFRV
jgi:uncharacterized protein YoxC